MKPGEDSVTPLAVSEAGIDEQPFRQGRPVTLPRSRIEAWNSAGLPQQAAVVIAQIRR